MQSTTTIAPSVIRKAAVTSEEKSTWPGESIKLIKWGIDPLPSSSSCSKYKDTPSARCLISTHFDLMQKTNSLFTSIKCNYQIKQTVAMSRPFSCALDGHTTFLLICAGVCEACIACSLGGDDAGLTNQGIGQGGFSMVHVRDHTHGTDVIRLIHDLSHLVHREVRHRDWRSPQGGNYKTDYNGNNLWLNSWQQLHKNDSRNMYG